MTFKKKTQTECLKEQIGNQIAELVAQRNDCSCSSATWNDLTKAIDELNKQYSSLETVAKTEVEKKETAKKTLGGVSKDTIIGTVGSVVVAWAVTHAEQVSYVTKTGLGMMSETFKGFRGLGKK